MPDAKLHIGCLPLIFPFPVMPSYYLSVTNSGFNYSEVIHKRADDSLYIDMGSMVDHLGKKNFITLRNQAELLSFGFKIKRKHYFSLSLTEKMQARFSYPKDLVSMAWYGNSQFIGGTADLSGLAFDWIHYRETALGYTNQVDDKLTIGGRLKVLFGNSNFWTKKSNLTLSIAENDYTFTIAGDSWFNMSLPEEVYSETEEAADSASGDFIEFDNLEPLDYFINTKNLGLALDLGASYKINKNFMVSASLIDFGYIRWKSGTRNYKTLDKTFVFEGVDIQSFFDKDSAERAEAIDKLGDSLKAAYNYEQSSDPYWGPLNPAIYLSGYWTINDKQKLGLIMRGEIYRGGFHPSVAVAFNRNFGNALSFGLTYSYMNRSFLNLGVGSALKIGPIQLFLATDNLFAAILPDKMKNLTLHFGCNWAFFYKSYYPLWDNAY